MNERITQPFDPYEPEPSYDWDYGEQTPPGRPKVLWGRVAVLGAGAVLAFLFGRCTAPDDNAELQRSLANARQDLRDAEAALEALSEQDDQDTVPTGGPTTEPTEGTGEDDEDTTIEGRTYIVESGDTFASIADRFYGDPSLGDELADANNYDDPTTLRTGDKIVIPPEEQLRE